MHCSADGGQTLRGGEWRLEGERRRGRDGCLALRWLPLSCSPLPALHQLPFSVHGSLHLLGLFQPPPPPPILNPYRSRPRCRHGAGVAGPSLRRLPVLFVGSLEHLLHVGDLVLAHRRHVHVAPERQRRGDTEEESRSWTWNAARPT